MCNLPKLNIVPTTNLNNMKNQSPKTEVYQPILNVLPSKNAENAPEMNYLIQSSQKSISIMRLFTILFFAILSFATNAQLTCPQFTASCDIDWESPTTATTTLLTYELTCDGRDIVVSLARTASSGNYPMGVLTGAEGNGSLQGARLGIGGNDNTFRFENYSMTFTEDGAPLEVKNIELGFYAINNNEDGGEEIQDFATNGTATTISHVSYAGANSGANGGAGTTFDGTNLVGIYNGAAGPNTCCNDGGVLTFEDPDGFSEITFQRDQEINRTGNFTNGITLAGGAFDESIGTFCIQAAEVCNDGIDNDGDGLIDCDDPDCVLDTDCLETPVCNLSYEPIDWDESNCMTTELMNADLQSEGTTGNIFIEKCDENGDPLSTNVGVVVSNPTNTFGNQTFNYNFNSNASSLQSGGTTIRQGYNGTGNGDNKICYTFSDPVPIQLMNVGVETFDNMAVEFTAFDENGDPVAMAGTLEGLNGAAATTSTSLNGAFVQAVPNNIVMTNDTVLVFDGTNGNGSLNYGVSTYGLVSEFCIAMRGRDGDDLDYEIKTCSQDCAPTVVDCDYLQCELPTNISAVANQNACPTETAIVDVTFDSPEVNPAASSFIIELRDGAVVEYSGPGTATSGSVAGVEDGTYDVVIVNSVTGCESTESVQVTVANIFCDKDGDGVSDANDLDDDNDGISDADECFVPNPQFSEQISWDPYDQNDLTNQGLFQGNLITYEIFPEPSQVGEIFLMTANGNQGMTVWEDASVFSPAATGPTNGMTINTGALTSGDRVKACFTFAMPLTNPVINVGDFDRTAMDFAPYGGVDSIVLLSSNGNIETDGLIFQAIDPNTAGALDYTNPLGSTPSGYGSLQVFGTFTELCWDYLHQNDNGPEQHFFGFTAFDQDCPDLDGDGLINACDLDSDGDGCPDALEGDAGLSAGALVNSSLPGGDGSSKTITVTDPSQPSCTATITISGAGPCADKDGDGVFDQDDLDDDNDGILDTDECPSLGIDDQNGFGYGVNMVQAVFHGAMGRTEDGGLTVFGDELSADGTTDLGFPTAVTPANGYTYTGDLLDGTIGGDFQERVQAFVLSTDGLWVWGTQGIVIDASLTSSTAFQMMSLPAGVSPTDVKDMTASSEGIVLLLNDGSVYSMGITNTHYGDGTTSNDALWHQASVAPIDDIKVHFGNVFAKGTDGTLYTWGATTFLGDGTLATERLTPTAMVDPLPAGVDIAQIAISGESTAFSATGSSDGTSYYVLGTDGKVYVMGENESGHLGIGPLASGNNFPDSPTWTNMRNTDNSADLTDVRFISAMDNDVAAPTASVILSDGTLLSMGTNDGSRRQIGGPANTNYNLPIVPNATAGSVYFNVENGGHITPVIRADGTYCNVGHDKAGAFGDGGTGDEGTDPNYSCNTNFMADLMAFIEPGACDPDGDGLSNECDPDSDGDGCPDAVEAGIANVDLDNNFMNDTITGGVDMDGVPLLAMGGATPVDVTDDGTPDYLDSLWQYACQEEVPCTPTAYMVQGSTSQWNSVNITKGTTVENEPDNYLSTLNAIGYNTIDNKIYGLTTQAPDQHRVAISTPNGDGTWTTSLSPIIAGLPVGGYHNGDVNANGEMYVYSNSGTEYYVIDADPASATYLEVTSTVAITNNSSPSVSLNISDFAFYPGGSGNLYAIRNAGTNREIIRINTNTGVQVRLHYSAKYQFCEWNGI